jgi:hypothetical protein
MVVKKTSTKTAAKKTAGKNDKKQLVVVSGSMCFWVNNGPILSSLKDLEHALQAMNDNQFNHHVGKGRNDFSAWVKTVLCDAKCASALSKAKNKKEAHEVVSKALSSYR